MTVFYAYAEVPADVRKVWEIDPAEDGRPWIRERGGELWSVEGDELPHGLVLTWAQLLEEFSPLTDDPAMAGVGLDALPSKSAETASISDELRQAAKRVRALPGCGFAEPLADWLEHTADNMSDEDAYEQTRDRADGSTYTVVVTDSDSHVGLSAEWTSALETARRINKAEVAR